VSVHKYITYICKRDFYYSMGSMSNWRAPFVWIFYDEVVSSAKEMSSLPSSCEYLFVTFHHLSLELSGPHSVIYTEWVGFWFRGSIRYPKPPNRRSLKRLVRGKLSHNPRGIITTHYNQCRTKDEEAPFKILKV
jgi:hypothetical protein